MTSECPVVKNDKWRLNQQVWHRMLYSCSHMATVGVKGLSYLLTDAGEYDGEMFYRLTAYGRDFHFNLTRNDRLASPSLVVEYWSRDGAVRRPAAEVTSRRCHYVGHVTSEETTSTVAFSSCFGLVSCVIGLSYLSADINWLLIDRKSISSYNKSLRISVLQFRKQQPIGI